MLRKEIVDVKDGKERMYIMTIRLDQGIAYPGLGEHECAFDPQIFKIMWIKGRGDTIWEEEVAAHVGPLWLADVCDGANSRGIG